MNKLEHLPFLQLKHIILIPRLQVEQVRTSTLLTNISTNLINEEEQKLCVYTGLG
ncbi:hypothetical protein [Methanobacterium sp.]|uniref:hypothetical protein n=1 Tax=Methanobacterium sp. TaxID=2164 RepID=UPI003D65BB63